MASVCLCVCVCTVEEKRLELSTPNMVYLAGHMHALTLRSQGQGHSIMKCSASVGMHVDMTAYISSKYVSK